MGALADADGDVVERYMYSPYGQTMVHSELKLADLYYHDCDVDGDIDEHDASHLVACYSEPTDPLCLFVHDQDADGEVDIDDLTAFLLEYVPGEAVPAPADWLHEDVIDFDCNGDRFIDLFDAHGLMTCFGRDDTLCDMIYDFDGDGEITLTDYEVFATIFGGPSSPRGDALQGTTGSTSIGHFGNPYLWTGQRYDPRTGLYHFMYRTYDPETGRWLQKDMLGALGALPDILLSGNGFGPSVAPVAAFAGSEYNSGLFLFLYASGNPTNITDPLGLFDWFGAADDFALDFYGHRTMALVELAGKVGRTVNAALVMAEFAVSMMPGGDAVLLMGRLALGMDFEWQDFAAAGASVVGGAVAGKLMTAFFKARRAQKAGRLLRFIPEGVEQNARLFRRWLKSKASPALEIGDDMARELIDTAKSLSVRGRATTVAELGKTGKTWKNVWHIHVGGEHIRVRPGFEY